MAALDPKGERTSFVGRRGLSGVQKVKNSGGWLAGQRAPHLHLSASGSFVDNAQKKLSPYPGVHRTEAKPSAQKP